MPTRAFTQGWRSPRLLVVAGLGLALMGLLRPVAELADPLGRNHNEGWNAYHARSLAHGGELYPPAEDFVSNNYPPLSFMILAACNRSGFDALTAGRLLALLGMLAVAAQVGRFVRSNTLSAGRGLFAASLFVAVVGAFYQDYVAMNDPQWMGQGLQWLGLGFLVGRGDLSRRQIVAATILFALGGLVKHNLVAVPLGATWWIWREHPRWRRSWCLAGALGLMGWAVVVATFGGQAFAGIFGHARVLSVEHFALTLSRWWLPVLPLLLVWGLAGGRNQTLGPFPAVAAVAIVSALVFSFGEGISYNVLFDVVAAGVVLALTRAELRPSSGWFLLLPVLAMAPRLVLQTSEALQSRSARVEAARDDLRWLEEHPGPILCENPAVAYRVRRPFEVGFFNYGQKLRTGRVDDTRLLQRLKGREFAIVQVDRSDATTALGERFRETLLRNYRRVRDSPVHGYFYRPIPDSTRTQ